MKTICSYADGTLLRRIVTTSIRSSAGGGSSLSDPSLGTQVSGVTRDTTTYFSPFIYKNGALDRTLVTGGYVKANVPYYYLRDHQGNIRQVVNGNTGAVAQESHYYPYGGLFGESSATALSSYNGCSASPYKFGGKEQVDLLDCSYLDFSARMYDYQLGRFHTPDPRYEESFDVDFHTYCHADPINRADPSGESDFLDKKGKLVRTIDDGSTAVYQQTGSGSHLRYEFVKFASGDDSDNAINLQSLIQEQQILNMGNECLKDDGNNTYCNFATQNILKSVKSALGTDVLLEGVANAMGEALSKGTNPNFIEVSEEEAQNYALNGGLALVSVIEPVHGHIATYSVGENIQHGAIANIGKAKSTGFVSLNKAISPKKSKHFYILVVNPLKEVESNGK